MQRLFQFTLDLFESRPAAAFAAPAESAESAALAPVADAVAAAPLLLATPPPKPLSPQTLTQALAPATFRHPRATRESLLGGILVAYEFKRGKRRSIGFSVGPDGLAVSAPKWVPLYEIDKAVSEKSAWILKKLQEARERQQRLESGRIEWQDGCTLPFLGETMTVLLDPRHAFGGVGAELKSSHTEMLPGVTNLTLHVGLPHSATAEQIRDAVQAWLMRQAKRIFTERLDHFGPHLSVQWRKLSLSSASTRWGSASANGSIRLNWRWGSASANGSIRLNWRLIHFKQSVIDYVVVHELSHLRVMDHSPRFWDTVRAVVPNYAELRGQLKDEGLPRW